MVCEFGVMLVFLCVFKVGDIFLYFCIGGIIGLFKIVMCSYGNEVVNVWVVG